MLELARRWLAELNELGLSEKGQTEPSENVTSEDFLDELPDTFSAKDARFVRLGNGQMLRLHLNEAIRSRRGCKRVEVLANARRTDRAIIAALTVLEGRSICAFANVAPELFVDLVRSAREGDLGRATRLHRRVLKLVTLGAHSDPAIGAVKLAMNKLGVPISPAVRGPALPATDEEGVEAVLRDTGLLASKAG